MTALTNSGGETTPSRAIVVSDACSAASDLRTRAGRRKEILDHIRFHGGFSIFWVTEHRLRAVVAEEMEKAGEIVTDNKTHGYPWLGVKILKQNKELADR
jgi:hypothetical protein